MSGRNSVAIFTAVCLLMLAAVSTYAYWLIQTPSISRVETGRLSGVILAETPDEREVDVSDVMRGGQVPNRIRVKNTGQQEMFVRVRLSPYWSDGEGTRLDGLDPSRIAVSLADTGQWVTFGDGWYYYRGILTPGSVTGEPLTESCGFVSGDNITSYEGRFAVLDARMECIQTGGGALETLWGISYSDLGVAAPAQGFPENAPITVVSFQNQDTGFVYDFVGEGFFLAFRQVVPGERHMQRVVIRNDSEEAVDIHLYADYDAPHSGSPQEQLVNSLLMQHTSLTMIGTTGTVFYDGPVWRERGGRNLLDLGHFRPGEQKTALLALDFSPDITNVYQELSGDVLWIFQAAGNRGERFSSTPVNKLPATDDRFGAVLLGMTGVVTVLSGLAAVQAVLGRNKSSGRQTGFRRGDLS